MNLDKLIKMFIVNAAVFLINIGLIIVRWGNELYNVWYFVPVAVYSLIACIRNFREIQKRMTDL